MHTINTTNPNQLIFSNKVLNIEVLGGIKLENLSVMRVTLKVASETSNEPPLRHNLDLYNDTQLEKFIRKVAERLAVGTSVVALSFAELTQELENYRLEKLEQQKSSAAHIEVKALSKEERESAIKELKKENLLETTIEALQQSGIIGEQENALILLLAMTSRKMQSPLSIVCLAKSGTGKSYLMDMVARCIPDEDKREQTEFTGNAFYYYKRDEIKGKVFIVKDLDGAQSVLFPMRELQSEGKISKTITRKGKEGKLETINLVVEGPVSVIACTTNETLYEDNANRSILIYLNDSKEQDDSIMYYQKQKRAGLIDTYKEKEIQYRLQLMQRVLEPIRVVNPYAPIIDLPDHFPKKRRALPILLNFIEAITFYHQYQRAQKADERTGEIYIESTKEDVISGFKYLKTVLFRRSDELSGALRDFYERLKQVVDIKIKPVENEPIKKFKVVEIREELRIAPRTFYHYLKTLIEYNYVQIVGGKQRTGYEYEIIQATTQDQLESSIDKYIEEVFIHIDKHIKASKKNVQRAKNMQESIAQ